MHPNQQSAALGFRVDAAPDIASLAESEPRRAKPVQDAVRSHTREQARAQQLLRSISPTYAEEDQTVGATLLLPPSSTYRGTYYTNTCRSARCSIESMAGRRPETRTSGCNA